MAVADVHPQAAELADFVAQSDSSLVGLGVLIQDLGRGEASDPLLLRDMGEKGLWLDASTHGLGGMNSLALLMALRKAGVVEYEAIIYKDKVSKAIEEDDEEDGEYTLDPAIREELRAQFRERVAAIIAAIGFISEDDLFKIAMEGSIYGGSNLDTNSIRLIAREAIDFNAGYARGFHDDANEAVDSLLEDTYKSEEEFLASVESKFNAFSSRAERYAQGGGQYAWSQAVMESSKAGGVDGCIWNCTFGEGTCADCISLHGQWMTWDDFDETFGETICNGGCQCGPVPAQSIEDVEPEDLDMSESEAA